MDGRFGHHVGGHHGLGVLLVLLGVIAIAALTSYLVVSMSRRSHATAPAPPYPPFAGPTATDRALETARVRYAQGDIDRDTYLRITSDLGGQPGGQPPPE